MRAQALARRDGAAAVRVGHVPVDADQDLSAAVLGARADARRFFCLEQPGRAGHALCGLGRRPWSSRVGPGPVPRGGGGLSHRGQREHWRTARSRTRRARRAPARCSWAASRSRRTAGAAPEWAEFAPAQLVLPELSLARHGGEARLTVTTAVQADDSLDAVLARVAELLGALRPTPMPLLDPDPVARARIAGAAPPAHYEEAVRRAVERIRADEIAKVVLAREVRVHAPSADRPRAGVRRPARGLRGLLLLLRGAARAGLRGCQPRAAGPARRRPRPDRRPGGHHSPQRRPGRGRPTSASSCSRAPRTGREQAIVAAADRARARPGERVGGGGRTSPSW